MKTHFSMALIGLFLCISFVKGQDVTILVSNAETSPIKTLEDALKEAEQQGGGKTINVLLDPNHGPINVANNGGHQLIWDLSGAESHPSNIRSVECRATVTRPEDYVLNSNYMFVLRGVQFVNITSVIFENASLGIQLDQVDYCKVQFCEFHGDHVKGGFGGAMLWLGVGQGWDPSVYPVSNQLSVFNQVTDNLFIGGRVDNNPQGYHALYLSRGSWDNELLRNTGRYPTGMTFHGNHGYTKRCIVKNNFAEHVKGPDKRAFFFEYNTAGPWHTLCDNVMAENIAYDNSNPPQSCGDIIELKHPIGPASVVSWGNKCFAYDEYSVDPLWLNYSASNITYRTVSGDWNGNGMTDMAAFHYIPGVGSRLHAWTTDEDRFIYRGGNGWLPDYMLGYDAGRLTGRMFSGDFNGDGRDDVGGFYDNGNGESRLHVFLSNGTHGFTHQGQLGWSSALIGSGYDASKYQHRVVSGDFNGDNLDDVATLFDYGSGTSRLHVFLSNGAGFDYQWSQGWSTYLENNPYDANAVTGRMVSGDFNGDQLDDIAMVVDLPGNSSRIDVFTSTGGAFNYNSNWCPVINSGYESNNLTFRLVAGHFDDNDFEDIAGYYRMPDNTTRLHSFLSSGSDFQYQGSAGWCNAINTAYDTDRFSGRVVAGNFNDDGYEDIALFYDYTEECAGPRTHMFRGTGNSFEYYKPGLGYYWFWDYTGYALRQSVTASDQAETLEVENDAAETFQLFPNPTATQFYVEANSTASTFVQIVITDLNGKLIKEKNAELTGKRLSFDVSEMPAGVYFVSIIGQANTEVKKLIVNR
ncbi:MAG: T9SS type A sorting domain-containing protein [Salibacteraceae bacterium]